LQDRLLSIVLKPRQMVQVGKLYVPEPRGSGPGDVGDAAAVTATTT
jgi:hypothetical protein